MSDYEACKKQNDTPSQNITFSKSLVKPDRTFYNIYPLQCGMGEEVVRLSNVTLVLYFDCL